MAIDLALELDPMYFDLFVDLNIDHCASQSDLLAKFSVCILHQQTSTGQHSLFDRVHFASHLFSSSGNFLSFLIAVFQQT